MDDPKNWNLGDTDFPFGKSSVIVATHSGATSEREWCSEYSIWLNANEFILKGDNGRVFKIHVSELG